MLILHFVAKWNACTEILTQFTERQNKKARTDAFDIPPSPVNGIDKRITDIRRQYNHQNGERKAADLIDGKRLIDLLHLHKKNPRDVITQQAKLIIFSRIWFHLSH